MKVKKILAFVLAIAMVLSVASFQVIAADTDSTTATATDTETATDTTDTTTETVSEFTDVVPGMSVYNAVKRLAQLGVLNGYPTGEFKPNENMTRAEFCTAIVRYLRLDSLVSETALTGFDDLDTDESYAWARPYVKVAVDQKIVNGYEDGTFRAAEQVKYVEAVKMIVCAVGYETEALARTISGGKWYTGYIAEAQLLKITSNAATSDVESSASRGIVAQLLYNGLDVEKKADYINTTGLEVTAGSKNADVTGRTKISGVVTGTYITGLTSGESDVEKDHIAITVDDEESIYQVGFSTNPNDFLGCKVTAYIEPAESSGDYDICTSIDLGKLNSVLTIDADCYYGYDSDDNTVEYSKDRDGTHKNASLASEFTVIYNGKYVEDFDLTDLDKTFENGTIELVNSNNDASYEVVRVNSYEVYVVDTPPTRSNSKIKLMYGATYDGEETLTFPDESTSLVFYLTRDGKEIEPTNLAKWDVLNIKRSSEDADGRAYYEVLVTRKTVSGEITERGSDGFIAIDGKEYYMSDAFIEYLESGDEDAPSMDPGDNTQVYLAADGKIVAAAETKSTTTSEAYAYLLGVRQNSSQSEYDLEFWIYTTSGEKKQIGSASKVTIDDKKYKATDDDVLEVLLDSADHANADIDDESRVYHQPIIYQLNESGLVSTIYTVDSTENDDISIWMNDDTTRFVAPEERTYSSSSKSFGDFRVSSSTKIIFVPDTRTSTDDYLTFTYSKAFTNARKYTVAAYGLTDSKTASLVILYHQNDLRTYTSSTPFMIVASKSETASGTIIKGYSGTSTTLKSVTVSEDDGPSVSSIGKGDVIRYILDSSNELIDYEIWFDASDSVQAEPVSDLSTAISNRILEIHSTRTEPYTNYPSATFRLQYGTVYDMVLNDDDDSIDEETITVVPTIPGDGIEMADSGNGVVTRTIGSSVKVFYYDTTSRNAEVVADAELSEILPYVDYGDSATKVITYSASGTLRMVYILGE